MNLPLFLVPKLKGVRQVLESVKIETGNLQKRSQTFSYSSFFMFK